MTDEHVFDLLPGYSLGCLDEDDLLRIARHLPHCAACRSELSSYWGTVDRLALAAPLQTPSPEVRRKLFNLIRQIQPQTTARRRNLLDIFRTPSLAWGALALVLIIALAISNFMLWGRVNQAQINVPADHVQIVSLLGTENAQETRGYLMVFEDEPYGTLVVENAPALEAGQQYQLWLIKDGQRTSGGVFSVDEHGYSALQVSADQPLNNYPAFGVTIEPAGGSPGPTGEKILGGEL